MLMCVLLEMAHGGAEAEAVPGGAAMPEGGLSDTVLEALLEAAPRASLETGRAWLDVRGLDAGQVRLKLEPRLRETGLEARFGTALRPAVAEVAARLAEPGRGIEVPAGGERDFLAPQPLVVLGVEDPLLGWLADVGIATCGELAAVPREAVEVRFGAEAVEWWRRARGADERRPFVRVAPERPQASVDFVDYVVTDPERLIFTTNALLGGLCEKMREGGAHARRLRLRLPLANGTVWERTLRAARPTADRAAWLRLARTLLERLTVPDSVAGVSLEVEATEAAGAVQGDLFDLGFATAGAVEAAVSRVLEDQGEVVREPIVSEHPLIEQRGAYRPLEVREVVAGTATDPPGHGSMLPQPDEPVGLTLQLLDEPRPVIVETARRRDHHVPVRYRDGRWHDIANAAGPDRISGGQWDVTYAREYFRAVTTAGALVWLFRDAGRDRWYLHGWWD
jgi:protein ImuB